MKFLILVFFFLEISCMLGQTSTKNKTVTQQAHEKKIHLKKFKLSNHEQFKVKVFTVDKKAQVNRTHHWFIQLLSADNQYVNFAKINVDGHLKDNPDIKFNYMSPLNKLCSDGKYIVGFVKVKSAGVYALNIAIDNFGKKDTIEIEIDIPAG